MRPSSAKAKGRTLQKLVASEILKAFPNLTERDVASTSMGVSGADVKLSEKASEVFPFSVECKNQESLNIWAALSQAEENAEGLYPLVVFKRNRSKVYAAIDLSVFMGLVSGKT